jgi:hypothetical protein
VPQRRRVPAPIVGGALFYGDEIDDARRGPAHPRQHPQAAERIERAAEWALANCPLEPDEAATDLIAR